MSDDFLDVEGGDAFRNLGRAFKVAADGKEIRKELLRELRAAGKPVTAAVRRDLAEKMPRKGGLAEHLARAKVATRNKLSGDSAGVAILTSVAGYDLPGIESGVVRHPTFGHRPWVSQKVPANVVTDAVESQIPAMRDAIATAIDHVLEKIDKEA